jgi:predicted metal-dependent peptidase
MLHELTRPKTDWRTILNDFVQEETVDYSFTPPDRRFSESPFLLPDFNETDEIVRNVLFMIDKSGSMTDKEVAQAYSEIKGAIDQFGGRLAGWLGFFDAKVVPPVPFGSESEFRMIRPKGGGGTSFHAVFDYIAEEMSGMEISSIVILTDGYAPFPPPEATMGIPVLWMINNDHITPPWGRAAVL